MNRAFLLAALVLSAAVALVYGPLVNGPFIFDDVATVTHNPSIRRLWPLWTNEAGESPLHVIGDNPVSSRPLVNLTLAVNYHFGQLNPRGYHLANLVLHVIAALILWAVVRRTFAARLFPTPVRPRG